jgi:hypothetical protein
MDAGKKKAKLPDVTIPIDSWDELVRKIINLKEGEDWIFRGQELKGKRAPFWDLEPTLERALRNCNISLNKASIIEKNLLREFQRRYHHYSSVVPEEDDYLEWFSIMAHYGTPTRFLDWTYSRYIAIFFALEKADVKAGCSIWAVRGEWLHDKVKSVCVNRLGSHPNFKRKEHFEEVFIRGRQGKPKPLVADVNPKRLNERLSIQQGVFLCPADITKPFKENISALASPDEIKVNVIKYAIKDNVAKIREKGIQELYRMNISKASLFPGLEGFAKSFWTRIVFDPRLRRPRPTL